MQVISGVNNSAFFAQSAYSASTASYDVNGYPITSYLPESGVGYNAVNEVSALNGSAIAQYGAEKQFLVHDDTLCHLSNSAQFALGVNLSAVAQLLGIDETVLWSGSTATGTLNLSGDISAYKYIEITVKDQNGYNNVQKFDSSASGFNVSLLTLYPGQTNKIIQRFGLLTASDQSHLDYVSGGRVVFGTGANDFAMISGPNVISIIGIGRKEV